MIRTAARLLAAVPVACLATELKEGSARGRERLHLAAAQWMERRGHGPNDGLVPVSTLGSERFFYDEAARTLDSEHGRVSYSVGQRIDLRLMDANPVSGALRFELPDAPEGGFRNRPPRRDGLKKDKAGKHMVGKRGRPANIRHKGRKR